MDPEISGYENIIIRGLFLGQTRRQMLAKVDAIAVDDLTELATELYTVDRLSAACVGADEDLFRSALTPVSEALVAA